MKKMTLLVTAIDEEEFDRDKINEFLDGGPYTQRGSLGFALLGGSGEINTTIALIKQLREVTGASLLDAKNAAYSIVEILCGLGTGKEMRDDLVKRIDEMTPHQVRMLRDHVQRNSDDIYKTPGIPGFRDV